MLSNSRALMVILLSNGISTATAIAQEVNNTNNEGSEKQTLETVTVYGRQQNDTLETIPQTVSVYGRESFDIGSSVTVGDVLSLVPTATRAGSSLDMFADDYLFRGFGAEQSTNGLGFRQTDHPTDLANVERIEVLKGPASVLYGQMEPGGTINVVTKQPLPDFQGEVGLESGSYGRKRTAVDITGPLSNNIRARLNLAYLDSDSSIDFWENQRLFIAPNITMDLSDRTNLTIEGSYSSNDWTGINGGTPIEGAIVSNPNGDYDKSFNPGWKDSFTERDSKFANARLTHAVTENIDARLSYAYTHNKAEWQEYAPFGLHGDSRTLDRIIFAGNDTYKKDQDVIVDLTGQLDTGPVTHKFIAGVNYRDTDLSRPTQVFLDFANFLAGNGTYPIDIFNPQYTAADVSEGNRFRDRTVEQDGEVLAGFIQDRITVAEHWHLLAGLRYTDSEQSQITIDNSDGSAEKDGVNETGWSSQLGLVYDLTDSTALYTSRSESFVPQQGTTSGRKPLEAEEGTQYEAGIRINVGNLRVGAAGFVIEKDNIAIEDPLDDGFEIAQGEARSKGVELSISGNLTSNWYLAAAYGYTDTEIVRSDDPQLEGNQFANIPNHTLSLQSRYRIPTVPGLSVGGTVTYLDNRFGDDENHFELPGYTRADLAAYYAVSDALQMDLLVDNLFDEEIFSPGSFDGVVREPERTYLARVKYTF